MRERPGKLTLIALGPLTNVALALRRRPELATDVGEIIVMGGALHVPGNVTEHAEFNIYNDPAAASIVFGSGAPVKLLGLDVTSQVAISRSDDPWSKDGSKTALLARCILNSWFECHPGADGYSLHDPLTVAAAPRRWPFLDLTTLGQKMDRRRLCWPGAFSIRGLSVTQALMGTACTTR